jgi:hypothetical protein
MQDRSDWRHACANRFHHGAHRTNVAQKIIAFKNLHPDAAERRKVPSCGRSP